MTETKPCVRCGRPIDPYARICVYCNWDQNEPVPAEAAAASATPAYVPPPDHRARNRMLGLIGLVALVIIAFVVGTLIHGFEPNEVKAAQSTEPAPSTQAPVASAPNPNITLVPVTDNMPAPEIEQPVTSAPPQAPGQEASDATALPAAEYAAVAAKAKAQKEKPPAPPVDPRELRGNAYDAGERQQAAAVDHASPNDESAPAPEAAQPEPSSPARNAETAEPASPAPQRLPVRTEAFPEYRPLPDIHVDREMSARLNVTVGPDGHVKDIEIVDPVAGATTRLIRAVQTWRFRPATENGVPVSARVAVTITLHSNG